MSDVRRYWVDGRDMFGATDSVDPKTLVDPDHLREVALASDYDRDTQALKEQLAVATADNAALLRLLRDMIDHDLAISNDEYKNLDEHNRMVESICMRTKHVFAADQHHGTALLDEMARLQWRVKWLEEGRELLLLSRDHCATLTPPISDWFAREPR